MAEYTAASAAINLFPAARGFQAKAAKLVSGITADVSLNPIAAGFRAATEKLAAGIKADVDVGADTTRARSDVSEEKRRTDDTKATIQVDADTALARGRIASIRGRMVTIQLDVDTSRASSILTGFTGRMAKLSVGTLGLAAATQAATALGSALAPSVGILALLPGLGLAGAAAFGTLKIGTQGFGDAVKLAFDPTKVEEFNEALAKLSPQAQGTVRALQGMNGAFTALRLDVQDRLFTGMTGTLSTLGANYLPMARGGFASMATTINAGVQAFAGYLNMPATIGMLRGATDNVTLGFQGFAGALNPGLQALTRMAAIGAEFLPGLGAGIAGVTERFNVFVQSAAGADRIRGWIQGALDVFRQLGALTGNVGSILGMVFAAVNTGGETFLQTLVRVSGALQTYMKTPEGAAGLAAFFDTVRVLTDSFLQKVVLLWPAISMLVATFATLLVAAGPLTDIMLQLVVGALVPLLHVVQFLAPVLGPLAVIIGAMAVATSLWTVASTFGAAAASAFSVAMGWSTAATNANTIATKANTLGMAAGRAMAFAMRAGLAVMAVATWALTSATWAQAMAQWGVNSALLANPITWIIIGIIALVAAVILAYQNFEWFRNIVQGAWTGIQVAASWAWSMLQPVFAAIWTGVQAVGGFFVWLWQAAVVPAWNAICTAISWAWNTVISPVLGFIWTALKVLGAVIFVILVAPFLIAFNLISAAALWLWEHAIRPAFQAIGTFIGWVWTALIQPALAALVWFWQAVITPAALWLWNTIIRPTFQALGTFIAWVWTALIKPALDALVWFWQNVIAPAAMWLWNTIIKPAFEGIGNIISWVWLNVIKPTFDAVSGALDWLGKRFEDATNWIRDIWNRIKGYLAVPINFMIDWVWNKGVVPAWNAVAGLVGLGPIAPLGLIPEAATGGYLGSSTAAAGGGLLRGPGTPTSDSILGLDSGGVPTARVSRDEFVVNAGVTRKTLPFLSALNSGNPGAMAAAGGRRNTDVLGSAADTYGVRRHRGRDEGLMLALGGIVGFGRRLQSMGYSVAEHPAFGGVGDHGPRSLHYSGNAIDVNAGAGTSPQEQARLSAIVPMAREYALRTIFMSPGHYNHAHFDTGQGPDIQGGGGGIGGVFDYFITKAREAFDGITNPLIDKVRGFVGPPPPAWREVVPALATKMRDTVRDFVFRKASEKDAEAGAGGVMGATGNDAPAIVRIISDVARGRFGGLAHKAAVTGTATGLVESNLTNIPGGDRDSVGVFQQRPSMGWGTVEQIMNVTYAAGKFFSKFPGNWAGWDQGQLAQHVQRSAFPAKYGQRMAQATGLVNQHGGFDQGGLAVGKGIMLKNIIDRERVLDPVQTRDYDTLTRAVRAVDVGPTSARLAEHTEPDRARQVEVNFPNAVFRDPVDVDMVAARLDFAQRSARL